MKRKKTAKKKTARKKTTRKKRIPSMETAVREFRHAGRFFLRSAAMRAHSSGKMSSLKKMQESIIKIEKSLRNLEKLGKRWK